MPGDAPHHALSHIAPLHLPYTQHMAGSTPYILHHTLNFLHTQHMAGDAPQHALSHTAPLHLLYTQHMAGDASRDVIDHATIGLGVGTFLLMVNDDHTSILHGYGDSLRGFKDFGVTSLTFCGHVTSSVT